MLALLTFTQSKMNLRSLLCLSIKVTQLLFGDMRSEYK